VAELIFGLSAETVRASLDRTRTEIAAALERSSSARANRPDVEILAATKYVSLEQMPVLADAGIRLVGENRAQDLRAKVAAHGELFEWDFIGQLQSRRVRLIVPHVRLIHSVASDSALRELGGEGEIRAVIGPGAGVCCYEVGEEVHAVLGGAHREGAHVDLKAIARDRLLGAGVAEVNDLELCTICDVRFFSYRREGSRAGRQAGVAWLS
jgi:hypothetical protein